MLDALLALSWQELLALVVAGTLGLYGHYLSKIIELRKEVHGLTLKSYYADHGAETSLSVLLTYVAIYWTIETGDAGLLLSFLCGYTCDSLANKFRGRGASSIDRLK